jgi:hypothetical protein
MKELLTKIYDQLKLQNKTDKVYFNLLPKNFDKNSLSIIYKLDMSNANSTFDDVINEKEMTLQVNINKNSTKEIYELAKIIIDDMHKLDVNYCKLINTAMVYNDQFDFFNYALIFQVKI